MKKNIREIAKSSFGLYLVIMLLNLGIVFVYNKIVALFMLVLILVVAYFHWFENQKRANEFTEYVENMNKHLISANHNAVLEMPIPVTIVNNEGIIVWYNSKMIDVLDSTHPMNEHIDDVIINFSLDKVHDYEDKEIKIGDGFYYIKSMSFSKTTSESGNLTLLFFENVTEYKKLKETTVDQKMVVAHIQIDNYDDLMNELKDEKKPFVTSEIDKKISTWATRVNGMMKKHEKDKYIVIFEQKYLQNLMLNRFAILDEIREIELGSHIPPTISIGISDNGNSPAKIEENAFAALELALGRGGDQAVVRVPGDYEFYGGRTKAVEKRNKVKARIIAHAFRPLLDDSDKVYIMGHQYPDMDAIGSGIGVYRACINRGKDAYIVLKEPNESIRLIYDKFKDDPNYKFIKPNEALENFDAERDLLVVVDTHRPSFTECPELLAEAQRVVLFDHHRRGKEFIEKTFLTYLEPYASSTSELVTEVLQYMEKKIIIEKKEAEALLAGIIVDTKNFSQQTGVRTFEAAAFLRKYDADITDVKQLFQDDLETFVQKAEIVKNAKIIRDTISISYSKKSILNARLIAAQAADQLLTIYGINTSFVIACEDDKIYISGRSIGTINVQLILESLGGGGHMNIAGAQFNKPEHNIEDVHHLLLNAISEYFKEEE